MLWSYFGLLWMYPQSFAVTAECRSTVWTLIIIPVFDIVVFCLKSRNSFRTLNMDVIKRQSWFHLQSYYKHIQGYREEKMQFWDWQIKNQMAWPLNMHPTALNMFDPTKWLYTHVPGPTFDWWADYLSYLSHWHFNDAQLHLNEVFYWCTIVIGNLWYWYTMCLLKM